MKILAQKRIWQESNYEEYIDSFRRLGHEVQETDIVPFTRVLNPEPDFTPDVVLGSGRLIDIAREKGWPTFRDFEPITYYPKFHYLNGWGESLTLGQLESCMEEGSRHNMIPRSLFVKPFTPKLFTAQVITDGRPINQQIQFSTSMVGDLDDELVWISKPQSIDWEERFIVIGGEIVAGSEYKRRSMDIRQHQASYSEINVSLDHSHLLKFARMLVENYGTPDDAFTLDIGETVHGPAIIELNNFNSAGVYLCDGQKIANALSQL